MTPASAKQKGRNLQKQVKTLFHKYGPTLGHDDVISRSSGANGEDVILSDKARSVYPISVECKNKKRFAVYADYAQAQQNANGHEPVLVIKQNDARPLAVVDAEWLVAMIAIATNKIHLST